MREEVSRSVAAPAERVWAIIIDIAGAARVISAIDKVEVLAGPDPLDVTPSGAEASTLTLSFEGRPQSTSKKVLSATVGRLMGSATRKALAKDLSDIAAAAESRS